MVDAKKKKKKEFSNKNNGGNGPFDAFYFQIHFLSFPPRKKSNILPGGIQSPIFWDKSFLAHY